jgi:hypothetical protein
MLDVLPRQAHSGQRHQMDEREVQELGLTTYAERGAVTVVLTLNVGPRHGRQVRCTASCAVHRSTLLPICDSSNP